MVKWLRSRKSIARRARTIMDDNSLLVESNNQLRNENQQLRQFINKRDEVIQRLMNNL